MQVILAKTILKKNSNSPCRVVPDTRKLFRNGSTWRFISIVAIAILAFGFALLSGKAFADAEVTFTVNVPDAALLEVELFNTDGTSLGSTASIDVVPSLSSAGFNEKSMVVSVGTNNEWGYNLVMNVSNTALTSQESNTIANLVEDTTNHANGYTCTAETAATCDFTLNSWGFRIDQATSLLSATNYIPVPSTLNINKNSTTTNGDPTYVSFGSRINASQAPGEYTTTITFAATANPEPKDYMQEVTSSRLIALMPNDGDTATVYDARDENDYEITRIDDDNGDPFYWMTDNLRITGTVTAALSNFTGANFNISTGSLTSGNSYTEARSAYDSAHPEYGAYYNYCAASAGTVCNNTAAADAEVDICPSGWRLPTSDEFSYIVELSDYVPSDSNWNPVAAGYYGNGTLDYTGLYGYWWSATARNAGNQYRLFYFSDNDYWDVSSSNKYNGYSVRCVFGS